MAAKNRERVARIGDPNLADHWLRAAAQWESDRPIEHVYGWELPPEYLPPGVQRTDELSVGPAGELVLVRRVYPAPGEVRFVPRGADG
jgi:hypothetical protein